MMRETKTHYNKLRGHALKEGKAYLSVSHLSNGHNNSTSCYERPWLERSVG